MRERPILFSAPMVRAILAGAKTQTRRALPTMMTLGRVEYPGRRDRMGYSRVNWLDTSEGLAAAVKGCRYGQPGNRLWVRETWLRHSVNVPNDYLYRADHPDDGIIGPAHGGWKPSIHMPRAASRILLEITGVRVERLQGISEDDAQSEGVVEWALNGGSPAALCADQFRDLWLSINGPGSWEADPWVWVVEFKRLSIPSQDTP